MADPPAADPPAQNAAAATTSSSAMSGGGSPAGFSQFNPGALDSAASAISAPRTTEIATTTPVTTGAQLLEGEILGTLPNQQAAVSAISAPMTTDITSIAPIVIGSQILGGSGLIQANAATSGAVAQAPTIAAISSVAIIGSQGEVIATSGGSSLTGGGASGRTMQECMEAWDKATHITKARWRQLCAVTLTEPHI